MAEIPRVKSFSKSSLRCLSDTIYFEARGAGKIGMRAVGHVVVNRVNSPYFPKTVCFAVNQPGQFSWVGTGLKVTDKASYKLAEKISYEILSGISKDPTNGATNFHRTDLDIDWSSKSMKKTVVIGEHQFYRLGGK
jgi:N-acetylmuramoyl-L-alanine amidase